MTNRSLHLKKKKKRIKKIRSKTSLVTRRIRQNRENKVLILNSHCTYNNCHNEQGSKSNLFLLMYRYLSWTWRGHFSHESTCRSFLELLYSWKRYERYQLLLLAQKIIHLLSLFLSLRHGILSRHSFIRFRFPILSFSSCRSSLFSPLSSRAMVSPGASSQRFARARFERRHDGKEEGGVSFN